MNEMNPMSPLDELRGKGPNPDGAEAHESVGDRNVERLLTRAYQPERIDPQFAARVTAKMLAVAQEESAARTRRGGRASRSRARTLGLLVWGGVAAAAAVALAVFLAKIPPQTPPDMPRAHEPRIAPRLAEGAPLARERLLAGRMSPRPRPAQHDPKPVAVGSSLRTGPGQRRRVTLPDGSLLYVNQNTAASVTGPRCLTLTMGEVYVEVCGAQSVSGAAAAFVIRTPTREVTALGTRLGVQVHDGKTGVLVTQGKVKVSGCDTPLYAGQQLRPDGGGGVAPMPRATHVLDWTRDLMAAAQSPLVPQSKYAGGALVAVDPAGQEMRLSLRRFHVDVYIEDGFTRTTIDQTYFNHSAGRLEGTFYFPLPPDASLSRLAMYVNGKLNEGGMVERSRARQVYESIVYRMQDPALLEWVDGTTFKMRVFPLEGRQEKRIILSYTQKLAVLYGQASYRFPAGHTMKNVGEWSFHARVRGAAGQGWLCDSHELTATTDGHDLLLDAREVNVDPDTDVVLELPAYHGGAGGPGAARFRAAAHEGYQYLMLRFQPDLPAVQRREHRHWVFLFETSGDRDPLLARTQIEVVRGLLASAEHDDTFNVLAAGTRTTLLAPRPMTATPDNVETAVAFLEATHLVGALDLEGALAAAAEQLQLGRNPHLVHLGSGTPILGCRRTDRLVEHLSAGGSWAPKYVGVGVGKRWNRAFMKAAAARTGGYFTQINPDEAVPWRAFELSATLNTPRLLNVRVTGTGGAPAFLCHDDSVAQGEEVCAILRVGEAGKLPQAVTVQGSLDGRPWAVQIPVRDVTPNAGYIPRTWARLEIERLLAEDPAKNKDAIVALSKAMYVMSPFTSLLVLENEQMYKEHNVDRGRKDHWALYPCPATIPVVHEPLRSAEQKDKPEGDKPKATDPWQKKVLESIRVRVPPPFFQPPDWTQSTPDNASHHTHSPNAWEFYGGAYAVQVGPAHGEWGGWVPADGRLAPILTKYGAAIRRYYGPVDGNDLLPYVLDGGSLYLGGTRWGWGAIEDSTELRQRLETVNFRVRNGYLTLHARLGDALQGSLGGAPEMTVEGIVPWYTVLRYPDERQGFMNLHRVVLISHDKVVGARVLGAYKRSVGIVPLISNAPVVEMLLQDETILLDMTSGTDLAHRWQRGGELSLIQGGLDLKYITYANQNGDAFWGGATQRLIRLGPIDVDGDGFWDGPRWDSRVLNVNSADPWVLRYLPWPEWRSPILGRPSWLYQRPTFTGLKAWLDNLVLYAPGLNTSAPDIQAALEAEAPPDARPKQGRIDPAARKLIDAARSAGWQELAPSGPADKDTPRFTFDGAGRYAYRRTLTWGLVEQVICDGKQLLHVYPEIGLAGRRAVSRFHRAAVTDAVPWLLPPVEDLAVEADVTCTDGKTVVITPRREGAAAPRPGAGAATGPAGAQADKYCVVHLVFGPDGRLAKRRLVAMPEGKTILQWAFGTDGMVEVLDGKGTLLADRKCKVRPAAAPELEPDLSEYVVLPMPMRTAEHVLQTRKLDLAKCQSWSEDDALAYIAGTPLALAGGEAGKDVIEKRFIARGDPRLGFHVLLQAKGYWGPPAATHRGGDPWADVPAAQAASPLARYVAACKAMDKAGDAGQLARFSDSGEGFLQRLAGFRYHWHELNRPEAQKEGSALRKSVRHALLKYVEGVSGAPSPFAWALLSQLAKVGCEPEFQDRLIDGFQRHGDFGALAYAGRYEAARALYQRGRTTEARERFRKLYADAAKDGHLPAIDKDFHDALVGHGWHELIRNAAEALAAKHSRFAVVVLAWQCKEVGDADLGAEIVDRAVVDASKDEKVPMSLAALEYYRGAQRWQQAEPAVAVLLEEEDLAKAAWLWRVAADVSGRLGRTASAARRLEHAVDLEFAALPEQVNVQWVRQRFGELLGRYQDLAKAVATLESVPPKDVLGAIIRTADRWRALDSDPTQACQAAAEALRQLGAVELAWDYLTTPLASQPNESDAWVSLAASLRQSGSADLADRAYATAFEIDPTNPQILWDRAELLRTRGEVQEARRLCRLIAEGSWGPKYKQVQEQATRALSDRP